MLDTVRCSCFPNTAHVARTECTGAIYFCCDQDNVLDNLSRRAVEPNWRKCHFFSSHTPRSSAISELFLHSCTKQTTKNHLYFTGVTKWPGIRNKETWGEGSHAKGQASLSVGAPCLLAPPFKSLLKWPSTQGSEHTS